MKEKPEEIGTSVQSSHWKIQIITALCSGLSFSAILYLIDIYVVDQQKEILTYFLQGVIFGILMGFIFPWLAKKYGSKMGTKLSKTISSELSPEETIEYEGPANLFRGVEGVGGKIFLTTHRFIFASHKFNIQKGNTEIFYSNIQNVEPRKTAKLVDNGIRITTLDSQSFDFVVNDRDRWIQILEDKIS